MDPDSASDADADANEDDDKDDDDDQSFQVIHGDKLPVDSNLTQTRHSRIDRNSRDAFTDPNPPARPTCGSAVGAGPVAWFLHQSFHTLPVRDLIRAHHDGRSFFFSFFFLILLLDDRNLRTPRCA